MINIAIDGPSGAGKSTLSRKLAESLGFIYVDTGALYRAIGYKMTSDGVDLKIPEAISAAISELPGDMISLKYIGGEQRVFCGEEDVSSKIRTPEISMAASAVSAVPAVRAALLELQKNLAARNNAVMDGRDIGTVVLPEANVKIFLTASPKERARRRYDELISKGQDVNYEDVLSDVNQRDYNDTHREIAPLKPAADSITVDTTGNSFEQSQKLLYKTVMKKLKHRPKTFYIVLCRFFAYPLVKLFFHVKVHGKENIPLTGGLIICANHTTMIDPIILGVMSRRQVYYMAKEELFKSKPVGWFLRKLGAFPVQRGTGGEAGLNSAIDAIKTGKLVGIFPEGTRSKDLSPQRGKSGTAVIARVTGADILPVAICCKKGRPKIFRKVDVFVGEVIPYPELDLGESGTMPEGLQESRKLKTAVSRIMNDITELWKKGNETIGRT